MKDQDFNISHIIVRYLRNELTDSEQQLLKQWLVDPKNQELFERLVDKQTLLDKSFEYDNDNPEKAWSNINRQINNPFKPLKLLKYAATILLPLLVTLIIYRQMDVKNIEVSQQTEVEIGEKSAIIYLSDGQLINLKQDTSSLIRSENELLIHRDSNTLYIDDSYLTTGLDNKMNKIVTTKGMEYQLTLSDGTRVWLNADSKLEFPSKFSPKERRVIVSGELYFDVAENTEVPFIVKSQSSELKVLGTEFNIRSYDDELSTVSTLIEGSVEVSNTKGETIRLKPGYEALIAHNDTKLESQVADIEAVTAWKNGRFYFDNQDLKRIMEDLSRWYDVDIFYFNTEVRLKRFSVDVPRYQHINEVLQLMEGTGDVKFEINNRTILVK